MKQTTTTAKRSRIVLATIALVAAGLSALGCSDPYAEVRAGLSPDELERFDRGARVASPCAVCHDLAGEGVKIGPHLNRLVGRQAGSLPGFAYSPAMQRSGVTWDVRTLDAFLAEPQRVVPGNRMVSPGVADSHARADLVFFLMRAGGRVASASGRPAGAATGS